MNQINSRLSEARTWIVKHAKEVMSRVEKCPEGRPIILKMGYGPSGTPHIGTITELVRTCMVAKALRQLQSRQVIVLSFCDDLDGMRKVPPGSPNIDMMATYMGYPLCRVPDPYESSQSFAESNVKHLRRMIEEFGYSVLDYRPTREDQYSIQRITELSSEIGEGVIIIRASDMYASGSYNKHLAEILQSYKKVLDIVVPTLGPERASSYSPFMPISSKSGRVLEKGVMEYHPEEKSILVVEDGETSRIRVEDDNCKLQWKIDFAMQWICLGVDYEMSGKDIAIGTYPVSRAVLEALSYEPPITPMYEMFLAEDGTRISKTKGNGLSLSDLLKYTSVEVVRHFMFLNPSTAKRLDMQKIPSYIDAFVKDLEAFNELVTNGENEMQIPEENPIWYSEKSGLPNPSFNGSTILNVIQGLHPLNPQTVVDFLMNTRNMKLSELDIKLIHSMYDYYHDHHTKPNYEHIPESCKKYVEEFIPFLSSDAIEMQTKLYELGNKALANKDVPSLKGWFEILYSSLIGSKQGPRLGSFFALYGPEESEKLIRKAL